MLFESFKTLRSRTPHAAAFLVSVGDRTMPITWRQFTDDIAATCWIIQKHAKGAAIAVLGENSYEWMTVHAACLFSGAIAVPVDPNLSAEDIAHRIKMADVSVLMHSALYREKAHEVASTVPGLSTGSFGSRKTDLFLNAASAALRLVKKTIWDEDSIDTGRIATRVFTSGTTSEPRAVELTVEAIETFVTSTTRALPMIQGEKSLMLLPLHHIFGICAVYTMLCNGVELGVCPDFRRIYDVFERFRVDFAFLVPALADILGTKIEHRGMTAEEAFGQPIKWILTGGAPLSRQTYDKLSRLGIKTIGGYGLTETAACYSMSAIEDEPRPCSAGKISMAPGVETKVSADGELLVKGPCVMKGYYRMPEKTAAAFDSDGWYKTGDLGRIDSDGYVWITGRASRTIILSSGKKIAPEELEEKLMQLPGVLEAVVSGVGETREIKAAVYGNLPEDELRRSIGKMNVKLPVYERIKIIEIRKEPFERTASGKIKLG